MYEKIFQQTHFIDGQELSIKQTSQSPHETGSFSEPLPLFSDSRTIVVRGFQQPIHKDALDLYFTNELKSGGGPIDRIVMKEKEIFIVFSDQASMYVIYKL